MSSNRIAKSFKTFAELPIGEKQILNKFFHKEDLTRARKYLNKLVTPANEISESYTTIHSAIVAKLAKVFEAMKEVLPYQRPELRIISLGCGLADDFLALKIFLDLHNPACTLHYVGLDINDVANKEIQAEHQNYSGMTLLTVDASDTFEILNALSSANVMPPNGFDIILLRHPEITFPQSHTTFNKIISETIPFLSNEKSAVFFSTFDNVEFDKVKMAVNNPHFDSKQYLLNVKGCVVLPLATGGTGETESYCLLVNCKGPSLKIPVEILNKRFQQEIASAPNKTARFIKAITEKQYNVAFRYASSELNLKLLTILLKFKNHLKLEINEKSQTRDMTALDWVLKNVSSAKRDAVIALLTKHDAKVAASVIVPTVSPMR